MAWKIARGLVLVFAISGFLQAFVSRDRIAEHLGGFGLGPLLEATGFRAFLWWMGSRRSVVAGET